MLYIVVVIFILFGIYVWCFIFIFDVLLFGREYVVNLGIDYDGFVKKMLIVIVIFVLVVIVLVGLIIFFGLFVVNFVRELFKMYKYIYLMMGLLLFSVIVFVGGEFIVEKVFIFSIMLSVIIDFVGGIYFIYLLLKENKLW